MHASLCSLSAPSHVPHVRRAHERDRVRFPSQYEVHVLEVHVDHTAGSPALNTDSEQQISDARSRERSQRQTDEARIGVFGQPRARVTIANTQPVEKGPAGPHEALHAPVDHAVHARGTPARECARQEREANEIVEVRRMIAPVTQASSSSIAPSQPPQSPSHDRFRARSPSPQDPSHGGHSPQADHARGVAVVSTAASMTPPLHAANSEVAPIHCPQPGLHDRMREAVPGPQVVLQDHGLHRLHDTGVATVSTAHVQLPTTVTRPQVAVAAAALTTRTLACPRAVAGPRRQAVRAVRPRPHRPHARGCPARERTK